MKIKKLYKINLTTTVNDSTNNYEQDICGAGRSPNSGANSLIFSFKTDGRGGS